MNALKSIGTKVFTAIVATGLVAGAAFAASGTTITVTLPGAVTVGSAVLPGGQYKVTESSLADGSSLLVFRSDKGDATAVSAIRSAEPATDQKTSIVLSNDNGNLHLDKMFVAGESAGFQFAPSK